MVNAVINFFVYKLLGGIWKYGIVGSIKLFSKFYTMMFSVLYWLFIRLPLGIVRRNKKGI